MPNTAVLFTLLQELLRLREDYQALEEENSSIRNDAEESEAALRLRMEHVKRQAADAEARVVEVEAQKANMVPASSATVRSPSMCRRDPRICARRPQQSQCTDTFTVCMRYCLLLTMSNGLF
jgi:hypothetical protein